MMKKNQWVKVVQLEDTAGMFAAGLDRRRLGAEGRVFGHVPGHGGDVWWVAHGEPFRKSFGEGDISSYLAPYCFTELEVVEEA